MYIKLVGRSIQQLYPEQWSNKLNFYEPRLSKGKSTAEFEQHYVSLDIPLDAGAGDPAAPDCGQCWMLLIILCPSSALLSLFLYFLCSHMGRT